MKFSSSFILSNLLQFLISGTVALLIFALHSGATINSRPILVIFIAVILFLFLLYAPLISINEFVRSRVAKYKSKTLGRILIVFEQYDKVRKHPNLLYRMFFWMLINLASSSFVIYLLYYALGFSIDILPAIFITALGGWGIIFSITPGNIGIREGLMVLGAQLMAIPIPITLAVALLFRLLTFVIVASLSTYYAPKLLNTTLTKLNDIKG